MTIKREFTIGEIVRAGLWVVLFVFAVGARSNEVATLQKSQGDLKTTMESLQREVNGLKLEIVELKTVIKSTPAGRILR